MSADKAARSRGERAETPVTSEAIVEAAFRMIDERGGPAFSMRALAAEMGVFPATLYWHVGDRARLLGLVEARWVGEIEPPRHRADWRAWMTELARRFRAQAHRHPNVARMVMVERARNTDSLVLPDAIIGELARLDLGDDLVHAYNALVGAVQGFIVLELQMIAEPDAESTKAAESEMRTLAPERFPHIVEHFEQLADRSLAVRWTDGAASPLDESYEFLLRLLLDGLAARLEQGASRR